MIYLIRHGQTEANAAHHYLGKLASPLTNTGIIQHAAVLERLHDTALSRIITSPRERCTALADNLGKAHGLTAERDDRITELNFGVFEGMTYQEAKTNYPEVWKEWEQSDGDYALPEGESVNAFEKRVSAFAEFLKDDGETENIAVVTHGGVIGSLMSCLLELNVSDKWRFRAENGSVSRIQLTEGYAYLLL